MPEIYSVCMCVNSVIDNIWLYD